jgi:hypothetical protein
MNDDAMSPPPGPSDDADATGVFRLATAISRTAGTARAVTDLKDLLARQGTAGAPPDFVTLHYGADQDAGDILKQATATFGCAALHGGSSCLGVMSGDGATVREGRAIGALAIWDPAGSYGTASAPLEGDARAAAARAVRCALKRAGRSGEAPDLVWLTMAPGQEEAAILGIKDVVGCPAMIVGASSADDDVSGNWSQISPDGATNDGLVVSVLFPSVPFGFSFESGYAPTRHRGRVTQAEGRRLISIDGRPAAEVYAEWTGHPMRPDRGSASVLSAAAMMPLGRVVRVIDGIPFHILAHPATAHAEGHLDLFADVAEGEELWLMTATENTLVQRAGHIAETSRAQLAGGEVSGGLMVYCGGCMLSVRHRMDEVAAAVAGALDGAPFLGVFSFGEQGETSCGDSEHSNLMISCTTFGRRAG